MSSFEMDDRKKIGLGLTGFGVFFSFLGVLFFFDKGLLAMGNILFLSGVMLTIGLKSSLQFFMKPSNYKGTISFGVGFFFVIVGWPVLGMILEAYGFIVLFRFTIFSFHDFICSFLLSLEQCEIVPHKSEEQVLQGAERRQQTVFKRRRGKGQGMGFGKIIKGVLSFGFWPTVSVFIQKIPVLGWVFQQPFVRWASFVG
ncbi:hypothetical protein RHGRI_020318 [Rhododendron griersonianum]|uniref:Vesicle transport protein GOT1 n=1 Tax=Rhododendron griersonianum TaxID=479676 RepID=A0AAV6JIZ1_9ERIC|nr:hypothetical protein RHGRI_020318 [Rhododendron griersonianum]